MSQDNGSGSKLLVPLQLLFAEHVCSDPGNAHKRKDGDRCPLKMTLGLKTVWLQASALVPKSADFLYGYLYLTPRCLRCDPKVQCPTEQCIPQRNGPHYEVGKCDQPRWQGVGKFYDRLYLTYILANQYGNPRSVSDLPSEFIAKAPKYSECFRCKDFQGPHNLDAVIEPTLDSSSHAPNVYSIDTEFTPKGKVIFVMEVAILMSNRDIVLPMISARRNSIPGVAKPARRLHRQLRA
ncbi:hypothetical protein ANO14919_038280 [Xylariales sp. No.14919]|nr:hypothetical protein ANO14919_038280 [Xylariales sp. No.14919]